MNEIEHMETIAQEILEIFEVYAPPVPIELMLQHPRQGMWDEVDPSQLSGSFLSLKDRYSPRMSLARLLVRHVASSKWGREVGLFDIMQANIDYISNFARMLIMPRDMVLGLPTSNRNPMMMSNYFEVPPDDAEARLAELI